MKIYKLSGWQKNIIRYEMTRIIIIKKYVYVKMHIVHEYDY